MSFGDSWQDMKESPRMEFFAKLLYDYSKPSLYYCTECFRWWLNMDEKTCSNLRCKGSNKKYAWRYVKMVTRP